MKRIKLFIFSLLALSYLSFAQDSSFQVKKGDYKIFKLDALNLMGIGVQKLHLGYEVSPMRANSNNLPTIQFNLYVPFNSLNEDLEMDLGLEGGVELRFHQRPNSKTKLDAEGFYMGVAMDGGYSQFSVNDRYYKNDFSLSGDSERSQFNEYNRVRTSISFIVGGQAKLGDKLYFDGNIGAGWSNVNVKTKSTDSELANYIKQTSRFNPLFLHFEEGKGQRFYVPLSASIGYNFGNK